MVVGPGACLPLEWAYMVNFSAPEIPKVKGHWASAHSVGSGRRLVKELKDQWYMETACSAVQSRANYFSHCPAD